MKKGNKYLLCFAFSMFFYIYFNEWAVRVFLEDEKKNLTNSSWVPNHYLNMAVTLVDMGLIGSGLYFSVSLSELLNPLSDQWIRELMNENLVTKTVVWSKNKIAGYIKSPIDADDC